MENVLRLLEIVSGWLEVGPANNNPSIAEYFQRIYLV